MEQDLLKELEKDSVKELERELETLSTEPLKAYAVYMKLKKLRGGKNVQRVKETNRR